MNIKQIDGRDTAYEHISLNITKHQEKTGRYH